MVALYAVVCRQTGVTERWLGDMQCMIFEKVASTMLDTACPGKIIKLKDYDSGVKVRQVLLTAMLSSQYCWQQQHKRQPSGFRSCVSPDRFAPILMMSRHVLPSPSQDEGGPQDQWGTTALQGKDEAGKGQDDAGKTPMLHPAEPVPVRLESGPLDTAGGTSKDSPEGTKGSRKEMKGRQEETKGNQGATKEEAAAREARLCDHRSSLLHSVLFSLRGVTLQVTPHSYSLGVSALSKVAPVAVAIIACFVRWSLLLHSATAQLSKRTN